MKKCNKCGVELTEENHLNYDLLNSKYTCKECKRKYMKSYYIKNPRKPYKEWSQEEKQKHNETHNKYIKRTNYKYIKAYNKRQTELFNNEVSKKDRQFIKENMIDRDEIFNKVWSKIKSKGL